MANNIILPFSELQAELNDEAMIDPNAIIEITENGRYNVARYGYADVNVEGGGGSSDFTTAQVTLISTVEGQSANSFPYVAVGFEGEEEILTEANFGTTEEPYILQAVLYKGSCKMSGFNPSVADASYLDIDGNATAQFGIIGLQYILITGDCTITIGNAPK